jgi:hypothetical protein
LKASVCRQPARAEIAGHRVEVALGGVGEAVEEAVRASNTVRGPEKPARANSAARMPDCAAQPACMPLGPGALGEIFDDARGHRADDAERHRRSASC